MMVHNPLYVLTFYPIMIHKMAPGPPLMNEYNMCSNQHLCPQAQLPTPARAPLVPERTDFLEGDAPAATKVEAFLARALEATGSEAPSTAGALVPWICDALLSNHSVKAYGRDLAGALRSKVAQPLPSQPTPQRLNRVEYQRVWGQLRQTQPIGEVVHQRAD
jgi:hypothetical protein